MGKYEGFYSNQYKQDRYGNTTMMEKHSFYKVLKSWLGKHAEYANKKFLEIGSGRGALQDVVEDYTGIDYADSVQNYYHKPFIVSSAEKIPFDDNTFDVCWSYAVWEHIPDPEAAFSEVIRVTKTGGIFLLCPAWHCRPWFADGYQVRPYSDFSLRGKIYKLFIPFFDFLPFRMIKMSIWRLAVLLRYNHKKEFPLIYKKLKANYETFWQSDSDACNNLDPFPVILWFESRGCKCVSHPTRFKQFFCRTGTFEFQIEKE